MNSSVFIEQDLNLSLRELLDVQSLKELAEHFHRIHGLGTVVVSSAGDVLLNPHKTDDSSAKKIAAQIPARGSVTEVDVGGGQFYQVRPIIHEMDVVGAVGLGPYVKASPPARLSDLSTMMQSILEVLMFSAYKRHLTNMAHLESITFSYQQLEKANQDLQMSYEQLKEIDQMKSNFLAVVSHELRTPLTSVIGYSEMLLEGVGGDLTDMQRNYVGVIMEKGDQLLKLIKEILNLSKIEAGKMKLELQKANPREVVNIAVETVQPAAEKSNIKIKVDYDHAVPSEMLIDRDKFLQIMNNLLSNAVKFSKEGHDISVHLLLTAGKRETIKVNAEAGSFLLCSVSDQGVGIPQAFLDRVFEKFFQVDSSSTRSFGGTGLGLTITKSFVEMHGGQIWCESQEGVGTQFYFTLPLSA